MILFLDTSVLLKLYVEETDSDMIREAVDSGAEIAVSAVSYVEAHSAFARRQRDGSLARQDMTRILRAFEADWFSFGKVHLDDAVLRRAGKLCLKHPIRSLDALQLATALLVSEHQEEPFVFMTSDKRLQTAARREKLRV